MSWFPGHMIFGASIEPKISAAAEATSGLLTPLQTTSPVWTTHSTGKGRALISETALR